MNKEKINETIFQWATNWQKTIRYLQSRYRWLGYLLVVAAFLYLTAILFRSGIQMRTFSWKKFGEAGFLALFFYLISLLVQYAVWSRVLSYHHVVGWQDLAIYAKALVLRRLPGGIWHWVGRATMYSDVTQVPGKIVLQANFLEWAMLVLIAGGISVVGVSGIAILARGFLSFFLIFAATSLAYLWQPRRHPFHVKAAESLLWTVLYVAAWVCGGLIIYFYSNATGITALSLANAFWVWAVAGGSSLLLIIVPAGLGIREITLTWLLTPYLDPANSMLIAILIRFTFTAADLLWGTLGWILGRKAIRGQQMDNPVS